MSGIKHIKVSLAFRPESYLVVGDLLLTEKREIFFQFDPSFLPSSLSLSPFKLQNSLDPQIPSPKDAAIFDGLFGVFADSLPDGWGLLLMSKAMRKVGISYHTASALDRLSFIGHRGMGALVYEPVIDYVGEQQELIELARLAEGVNVVLEGKTEDVLPELLILGGSPAGARPKALVGIKRDQIDKMITKVVSGVDLLPEEYDPWLIKFRGKDENAEAGILEYIYMQVATKVGIKTEATQLFQDRKGNFWFGTKRFDRGPQERRIHVHTLAGLLHANLRLPSLDYEAFLQVTYALTKNNEDLLAAFRQAVFNVVFYNRDDHAKNFSFLLSEDKKWRLSPAYDLCYSMGPGGEHTTAILGEGKKPTRKHLVDLATKVGIDQQVSKRIIEEVEAGKSVMLSLLRQFEIKNHPIEKFLREF